MMRAMSLLPKPSSALLALFTLFLITIAVPAAAQTPVRKGDKSGGPLLTRAELRACMAQQDRIRELSAATVRERELLDKEKAELVAKGEALKAQLETLDRSDPVAVERYNAEATGRDQRIDAFEARMPPFNAKVEALAAERESLRSRCENRRYDELDEIQIKRGK